MNKLIKLTRFALRDPRAIYYYLQKGVRSYGLRSVLAGVIAKRRREPTSDPLSQQSSDWLKALRADGYVCVPNMVSTEQLSEIHAYLARLRCLDLSHPELGEFSLDTELSTQTRIARYKPEELLGCPHLLTAANNPDLISTIAGYIGCEPTLTLFEVWWSIPNADIESGAVNSHQDYQFHRDVEDFKFVKLFIYLTDVDESSGPHIFIAGSHDDGRLTQRASLDAGAVVEAFGASAEQSFVGRAGLGILEDTFGIHQAKPPSSERRLICSVTYSLTGLNPFSPQSPCTELPTGISPYVNRLFCR